MREGGTQLGIGVLLAVPVTAVASFVFSQILAMQVRVYVASAAGVIVVISCIVLWATYIPSRRAIALEPSEALWQE